ncbi:hypothetical protein KX928_08690 [Roseobacter sp. YSTF-M11]|uniref:Uncharacterized protein n=1 Tax=Roseobacter insulae TaxID=2859783 RepID=A0A9X1FVF6_9RHOB|nr:hypothetical protein [Roseobacter insulae]MBW4707860.1 hypothetical protein [Roseobacter insulae]
MSAPDTNIGKQKKRHRPALWGLWLGLALAVILVLAIVWFTGGEEAAAYGSLHQLV